MSCRWRRSPSKRQRRRPPNRNGSSCPPSLEKGTVNPLVNYWQYRPEKSGNRGQSRSLTLCPKEDAMKRVILATIAIVGLASACTVRSERTVVERPAPAQTAYVY